MKIKLLNTNSKNQVFSVPEFNFGQFQRWKENEPFKYSLEIDKFKFIEIFSSEFKEFRDNELLENDCFGIEELVAFKKNGSPTLEELFNKNLTLLKDLLIYHQYEILHLLIKQNNLGSNFYSINSIDKVIIKEKQIYFEGVCFEVNRK